MNRIISFALMFSIAVMLLSSVNFVSADNSDLILYNPPESTFDYYIEGDPQDITDEEFFGVWNKDAQIWTSKPYFDYDKYEGLAHVEYAVKEGNYDTAKDELLSYYRSVREDRSLDPASHPGSAYVKRAEALGLNAYTVSASQAGSIQDIITVDNEWDEYRINVTDSFSGSRVAGYLAERGFVLMSVDKNLTYAEFYSRESQYPPTLELTVNGMSVSILASKDATVRAGAYSSVNYGSDEILKVQESGYYLNFNENTYRSYVTFDISSLKPTDIVTSATLVLHGRNASGTGGKKIVVYRQNNTNYNENEINFNTFASDCLLWSCNDMNTWDYIASSDTGVKGKACWFHRGYELLYVAELYGYTKNEEYAYTFLRQHMGLVNGVGFDTGVFNELDLGVHLDLATESVMYVLNSEYMTGEILTAMIKNFWQQANYLVNIYYGRAYNNWGSFATKGVYAFLARFRELEVFDEWFELTKKENTRLAGGFAMEDGMAVELPLGYVNTLLSTISEPISISEVTGVALPYEDIVMKQTHGIVQTLIYCSGPGFRGFNMSESGDYANRYSSAVSVWYNSVFTEDEEFEYVATNGVSGKLPDNPTTHYPVGLRTYMRSSWDEDALAMAFTAKGNGSHGQYDRLSISMYAYGEFLLTDQAYGALLTDNTQEFMATTGQHNAVTVNGKNQIMKKKDGVEEAFESNKLYDFIEYSGDFTEDAAQRRSVLFLKNQKFWIVTDFADPYDDSALNSYEQNWHMLPSANMTVNEDTLILRSNMENANVMVVPVKPEDLTVSREYSLFSPINGSFIETKKAVLKKNAVGNTTFSTVIIPMNSNEKFDVEIQNINVESNNNLTNAFVCKITDLITDETNYYYYYHHNEPENKQTVRIKDYETDAATMMIQTDEDYNFVSMFLMDATFLNDDSLGTENVRFKSNTPVEAIAYEETGNVVKLYSSTLTDASQLDNLTIYAGYKNNVKLNGETAYGKKSGGYIYFGENPIITGSELPEHGTGNNNGTTGGGTHGMGGSGGSAGSGGSGIVGPGSTGVVIPSADNNQQMGDTDSSPAEIPSNIANELKGHWGEVPIKSLYEDGIITGDNKGLRLKDSISRAEFTALIIRALKLETAEYKDTFTDIDKSDWYAPYIAAAYENGLVNGADGMFKPNDTITREEICKITAAALYEEPQIKELDFTDTYEISEWAIDSVKKAYSLGIVNGMGSGIFAPKSNALHEQAFVIIARLLETTK